MFRFLLYAGAGAVGTAVHYTALLALSTRFAQAPSPTELAAASTAGALLGAITNYALNRNGTFALGRGAAVPHARALPRFVLVVCIGLAVNAITVATLTAACLPLIATQLCATALVLGCGYLLNRHWTFAWRSP